MSDKDMVDGLRELVASQIGPWGFLEDVAQRLDALADENQRLHKTIREQGARLQMTAARLSNYPGLSND